MVLHLLILKPTPSHKTNTFLQNQWFMIKAQTNISSSTYASLSFVYPFDQSHVFIYLLWISYKTFCPVFYAPQCIYLIPFKQKQW